MESLNTERLILRKWELSDSKDLFEYGRREEVGPNAGWPPHLNEEKSLEIIKGFIKNDEVYAVVLKSENKVVGSIGFHERSPEGKNELLKEREIGYVLNPNYWGMGIIPEGVIEVVRYGFEELGLDRIWCGHYSFNSRSRRVNEKCGFKYSFKRIEKLVSLDNKEAEVWYYNITNN